MNTLPLAALMLYLWLSDASPLIFCAFFTARAAKSKEVIEWSVAALILVFCYHLCLTYRFLGEYQWDFPAWHDRCLNHTPAPTPLFSVEGYAITTLIYTSLSFIMMAILPAVVYTRSLFWLSFTLALSFWYSVVWRLPSVYLKGTAAIIPILCVVPAIALHLWASPQKFVDICYVLAVAGVGSVLLGSGVHLHHSAWPWALVPLCRHGSISPDTKDSQFNYLNACTVAAGVFIGMATQEISGSGFRLSSANGY